MWQARQPVYRSSIARWRAYAPFVPESARAQVVDALRAGEAVLGTSSAQLRHLTVGGSLTFDQATVPVGAIVPDPVAGWSEMLVSRTVGRSPISAIARWHRLLHR
jgi:hypothetical protein